MKTRSLRGCQLGGAVLSVVLTMGCLGQSPLAQSDNTVVATPPVVAPPDSNTTASAATTATNLPPGAIASAPVREVAPALPKLSPVVAEIVKLAQARVSDEVLLAYLDKSGGEFVLTAEEIVYLHDIGVSEAVITALIKRSKASPVVAAKIPPSAVPSPEPAAPPIMEAQPVQVPVAYEPAPSTTVPVVMAGAPQPVTYFYQSLAPYGSWLEVPDYGWCWQPTVAIIDTTWRPYCHRGRWLYTDSGWYWQSDYSWGWAPFHYGRWCYHARRGWVWVPGSTWAPAWVSWRRSANYCGWAPLPPDAYYGTRGFTQHGFRVGVNFEFGLSYHYYSFLPVARFCDVNPYSHYVWGASATAIYQQSTVVNNYHLGRNTIVNAGPLTREQVAKASRSEVRKVAVLDLPSTGGSAVRPDRLMPAGQSLAIYRPTLQSPLFENTSARPRRDQELRKDTALSATTTVPITRKESGPRSQAAVTGSAAAPGSAPLDNGANMRPGSPPAPLNRDGQANGTRSPFAPALSGNVPQSSRQEPEKSGSLRRRTVGAATTESVNSASSLPRPGVDVPSAPQPVTSVPTLPRPSREILRPPQPIAPMQPNVRPGREFTSAPHPVTSVPTTPRAGVAVLKAPEPLSPMQPAVRPGLEIPGPPNTFRSQTTAPQFNAAGSVYQPRPLYNPQPLVNQPAYQAPVQRQELRRTPPNSFQRSYTPTPIQPQTSRPSYVNPAGPTTRPQAAPSPQHRPQFITPSATPSAPVSRPSFQNAPAPSAAPSRPSYIAPPATPTHRSEPSHAPAISRPSSPTSPGRTSGSRREENKR